MVVPHHIAGASTLNGLQWNEIARSLKRPARAPRYKALQTVAGACSMQLHWGRRDLATTLSRIPISLALLSCISQLRIFAPFVNMQ